MNWSGFRYENFDVRVSGEHATSALMLGALAWAAVKLKRRLAR